MPVWQDVDDAQLLKIAQEGEPEAFGELYERHAKAIFRFLYARLDNQLDAEDLTEEVFLRFWRSLPKYREQGIPLSAYLYRVANNALVDHYRRNKNSSRDMPIEDGVVADEHSNPADLANKNLDRAEMRQALEQLREDYREVLVLRFLSELSPTETAKVMKRSVGAVRILQHRALSAMRGLLDGDLNSKNGKQEG